MANSLPRRRLVSAFGAGAALFGSGRTTGVLGAQPASSTGHVTVGSIPGARYPSGWGPDELEQTLQHFIAAFNEGDQAMLSRFIPAKTGHFNDWTPDELLGFSSYGAVGTSSHSGYHTSRTDVLADFAARHGQQERWDLAALSVAPTGSSEALLYQMLIERTVHGGSPSLGLGMGLLYTPDRTIPVWSVQPAPTGLVRLTPPFLDEPSASLALPAKIENADDELPSDCDAAALAAALQHFFAAFNAGDEAALRKFVSRNAVPAGSAPARDRLSWYGVSAQFGAVDSKFLGRSQDEVIAYFAARHKQREQLRLISLPQLSWDGRTRAVGFVPYIARWADDVAPHVATGKMGMSCPDFQIQVWNQGPAPSIMPGV